MFCKGFYKALRALHHSSMLHPPPTHPTRHATNTRPLCMASTAAAGSSALHLAVKNTAFRLGSAFMLGGGAAIAWSQGAANENQDEYKQSTYDVPWVQAILAEDAVQEVLTPGQMLRKHPVGKLIVDQDHLFEAMVQSNQIKEFKCFYNKESRQFHSVVQLGKDVCGFPQTVHGGLTAAIVDETLGGLGVCLWKSGALGMRPPAYTARLEVNYKKKIPAGSLILCSTELEKVEDGRKIWMRATVSNGNGTVYATARALFVAPKLQSILTSWLPGRRMQ